LNIPKKPSCPGKNEHYNPISKKCECVPGCLRGKKNICEPEPPKCPKPNEIYDPVSKKCSESIPPDHVLSGAFLY
jgi:hypothetical protein